MIREKSDTQKTYEYLYEYFSNKIISGELKLNDKLAPEREVAEQLNVSRNSVREVMHMLEITGLIECMQGNGNYVRCNPKEYMLKSVNMVMALLDIDYTEIFYIRRGFEYTALQLAIEVATPEEIEKMHDILEKMEEPMSLKESAMYDKQFHDAIMNASHNRLLIIYYSMLEDLMNKFIVNLRCKILTSGKRAAALKKSHWGIYNSIVEKDQESGRKEMERHFKLVEEQLIKIQKVRNKSDVKQ